MRLREQRPDLIVIACNTASTLALAELRARFAVPFVGTVPAIKPACAQSASQARRGAGHAGDRQPRIYPRADPRIRAGLRSRISSAPRAWPPLPRQNLAALRRATLTSPPKSPAALSATAAAAPTPWCSPARITRCSPTRFRALAPWPVAWLDPAPAIARRVTDLIGPPANRRAAPPARLIFTSGKAPSPRLGESPCRLWVCASSHGRPRDLTRRLSPLNTPRPAGSRPCRAFRDPRQDLTL